MAIKINRLPRIEPENPESSKGLRIIAKIPARLMNVPKRSLPVTFSLKKMIDAIIRIIGPDEIIIGAFMLGESLRPKKRRGIKNVTETRESKIKFGISCFLIFKYL